MPIDFQPEGNKIDFQPLDFQSDAGPKQPYQMDDAEIATKVLGWSPDKFQNMTRSWNYKPGMLKAGFDDPNSLYSKYIGKSVLGTFAGGIRQGANAVEQLIKAVALPAGHPDRLLAEALGGVSKANTDINSQGSPLNKLANIAGQPVVGAALTSGIVPASTAGASLGARLSANAAPAAGTAYLTTPGTPADRARAAVLAGSVGGAVGEASRGVRILAQKMKNKALDVGTTPSVKETFDDLANQMGGTEPGDYLQAASRKKLSDAFNKARDAGYRSVDAVKKDIDVDLTPGIEKLRKVVNSAENSLSPVHPEQLGFLKEVLDRTEKAQTAPFGDVMTLVSDIGKKLWSLQKQHGSMIDRDAFEGVKNGFIQALENADTAASKDLSSANSVFSGEAGPLIQNKKLVELRDTGTPGDYLRKLAQGPLRNVAPQQTAEIAAGSSPTPILHQFYENALTQSAGRPGGFIPSAEKVLPAVEAIDPALANTLQRQIGVANASKGAGAVANYLGGKVFGTPAAIVGSFNPAISGPGGVWGALQRPGVRDWLTQYGSSPVGTSADDAFRAMLMGSLLGRPVGQPQQQEIDFQ